MENYLELLNNISRKDAAEIQSFLVKITGIYGFLFSPFLTYLFIRGFKKGLQVYSCKYVFLTRSCVVGMTLVSLSTLGRSARDCYPGHSVPVHGAAFASRPGTF